MINHLIIHYIEYKNFIFQILINFKQKTKMEL
jgi:hypothetical protein